MKRIILFVLSVALFTVFTTSEVNAQQRNKGKSKEANEKSHGNQENNANVQKENHGNSANMGQPSGKNAGQNNQRKGNESANSQGNMGKGNNGRNDQMGKKGMNNGRNDEMGNKGMNNMNEGYKWNRENFKDRKKIKSQDKVTICHKFNNNNEPAVTIRVSQNAVKAHMNHGDIIGVCPPVTDKRYSNKFLDERKDYYNKVQEAQDQVVYSRSIYDYAMERLATARQQLEIMRSNRLPTPEIQRKEVVVTELQQNVSLLQTVLGITANIIADKLNN
jgi:hypothetical protein